MIAPVTLAREFLSLLTLASTPRAILYSKVDRCGTFRIDEVETLWALANPADYSVAEYCEPLLSTRALDFNPNSLLFLSAQGHSVR